MLLSDTFVARFRRNGYVIIPGLLTDTEWTRYASLVRDAVLRRTRRDTRPLSEKSAYEQSFIQCMNLWEDFPAIRPLTFHPKICQAAAELLGVQAVRLWHDQALFKEAGGRRTDPHQDFPYWTMQETETITAWIPFDGTTRDNGCMGYIPGSHITGVRRFVNIFQAGKEDLNAQARDLLTGDFVYEEVPRGSIAFHHGLTTHEAEPNTTDRTRAVHTMILFRDGITRSTKGRHFAVDRAGIQPGAPIASDVTPIAWPLPAGRLPEPPPPMTDLLADVPHQWLASGAFPEPGPAST
ncbi:MAG: phytanoyl-CoA dioxygenase family protein [Pseudomonadales bacterium]|nr:phytanoyl-CoA dioxygenase family protein [Pseudomonadales bacterium]MCP5185192.1 phytanoyl-CoA dioxygenase family protein [Pseudomonadales bacterium]